MPLAISGFDWDGGNRKKCESHGVLTADIEALFARPVTVFPDPAHSRIETRFKAIGTTARGRHVFVVFALRQRGDVTLIRPISARFMHRKEIRYYEEETAKAKKR
ncbi:MAG: BrnT family toxin [Rhizobiales bacterium]|nr:BrnT family toxin [Hyphomicrobiales bacterium]